jgi:hypothetical protein
MTRKGKFQLLSYLVDESLLYYKSLNKNKKIIAFAMFETIAINHIIPILNKYLTKRFISYYTIQWDTLKTDKKVFILSFEEEKKESIIKAYNELEKKLRRINSQHKFFNGSQLEGKFLAPILKEPTSKVSIVKENSSMLILNNNNSYLLDAYNLSLDYMENQEFFITNFLKILNSFKREGYLFFNFRLNNDDIVVFNPFYTDKHFKSEETFNTEQAINTFFKYGILKRQDLRIKHIFNCLWRLGITDDYSSLSIFNKLYPNEENEIAKLLKFNKNFEQNLLQHLIKFIRLGKNLLLIEEKFLFVVLLKLKSEYIKKIVEKYHSKYFIYITILNEKDLKKLLEIPKFKSLKNLQVLNTKEISDLNYDLFIQTEMLKYT